MEMAEMTRPGSNALVRSDATGSIVAVDETRNDEGRASVLNARRHGGTTPQSGKEDQTDLPLTDVEATNGL